MDAVHLKRITTKLPKNGCKTLERDHQDCRVVHVMPHSPPHIWARPCNQSLQLLYLPTLYYNHCTLLQIYTCGDCATLVPRLLRVPPPLTPVHALRPPSPSVTPAHAGSNIQGSGHQLWHRNPTVGHQR